MKSRIFKLLAVIAFAFVGGLVFSACGDGSIVKIVSVEGLNSEIVVGGTYSYDDAVAKVELSSGKVVEIQYSDLEFEDLVDTSEAGTQELLVKYTKDGTTITFVVSVEVFNDVPVSIKRVYDVASSVRYNGTLDTSNAKVVLGMRSGAERTITTSDVLLTIATPQTNSVGAKSVLVKYGTTISFNYAYEVVDYETAMAVDSGLADDVVVGGTYDMSQARLLVTYASGATSYVYANSSRLSFNPSTIDTSTAQDVNLVITYVGGEETVSVTKVINVYVDSVVEITSVSHLPLAIHTEEDYVVPTTSQATLLYRSGRQEVVATSSLQVGALDTSSDGEQTLTITHASGVTYSVVVDVYAEDTLKSLSVTNYSQDVLKDQVYDSSTTTAVATYRSGQTRDLTSDDLSFSAIDTSSVGNKELTISYTDGGVTKQAQVIVEVYEDRVVSIAVKSGLASTVEYGEIYDLSNAVITVTWRSGLTQDITYGALGLSFSNIATNEIGTKILTITYSSNGVSKQTEHAVTIVGSLQSATIKFGTYASAVDSFDFAHNCFTIYDTSNIEFELVFNKQNGTTQTRNIPASQLTSISNIDTTIPSEQTLTITYFDAALNKTFTASATVTVRKNFNALSCTTPKFVEDYRYNSVGTTNPYDGTTGERNFLIGGNAYVVGDDNDFLFQPSMRISQRNVGRTDITSFVADIKVFHILGENSEEELDADGIDFYFDNIDTFNHKFDFSEEAIDETFRIELTPAAVYDIDETISFTFNVIDGYNIYDAVGFSLLDNSNINGQWTAYKTAHSTDATLNPYNVDLSASPNALVLHSDILLSDEDIPASRFWTETEVANMIGAGETYQDKDGETKTIRSLLVGSIKDCGDYHIYRRMMPSGSKFRIEGNYFTLDASNLSYIAMEGSSPDNDRGNITINGQAITVHIDLFKLYGDQTATDDIVEYQINNLAMFGNSQKSQEVEKSGGLIAFKKSCCNVTLNNVFSQAWYISLFSDEGVKESADGSGLEFTHYATDLSQACLTLNDCAIYDAFNTILYSFGGYIYLNNSFMIGAGGPVMICDHVMLDGKNPDKNTGILTNVYTNNTKMQSLVVGSEAWFQLYDAVMLATQLKTLGGLLVSKDLSIITTGSDNVERLDLIAVFKSSSAQGITSMPINGTFNDMSVASDVEGAQATLQKFFNKFMPTEQQATQMYQSSLANWDNLDTFYAGVVNSIENDEQKAAQMQWLLGIASSIASGEYAKAGVQYFFGLLGQTGMMPSDVVSDMITGSLANWDNLDAFYAQVVASMPDAYKPQTQLATLIALNISRQVGIMSAVKDYTNDGSSIDGNDDLIHNYLDLAVRAGHMSVAQEAALYTSSMCFQTYNGAFTFVVPTESAENPYALQDFSSLTGVDLTAVGDYLNIYLPNGMVAVVGVTSTK